MVRLYHIFLLSAACVLAGPAVAADAADAGAQQQQLALLRKAHDAARQLDYSGVYTYQQGSVMVSSRIIHLMDGTGERERIEILDGAPREYLRHNESTRYLVPEKKLVITERRRADRFPALLLGDGSGIPVHYDIRVGPSRDRVAGRECALIELVPRDSHRYGYSFCTDIKTHLLLKAQTIAPPHGVIDQIVFTSLTIGDQVNPKDLESRWNIRDWKVLQSAMAPVDLAAGGWRIPAPPGYQPLTQVTRPMKGGKPVSQLVMSDGLAAISVFIEPFSPDRDDAVGDAAIHAGAMNIFRTRIGDFWLTTLGEVPAETLRDIAQRTEYVPLAGK
ncbi:siderophore-interacting protein [Parapusillimonas sp. SGNA-6]|nr:siderophore-interacting protein [Parapusillimonas sp. SGNA-6]